MPRRSGGKSPDARKHRDEFVYFDEWPQHLIPLCIDGATSLAFPAVLDIAHVEEFTVLRYYQSPTHARGVPRHLIQSGRWDGSRMLPMSTDLGDSQQSPAVQDAFCFRPVASGSICLVGATLSSLEDEAAGTYRLSVPNHAFYLNPRSVEQNAIFEPELRRIIRAANEPLHDCPIALLRLRIELFGDPSLSTPSSSRGGPGKMATTKIGAGASLSDARQGEEQPAHEEGAIAAADANCGTSAMSAASSPRALQRFIKGVYITVREGQLDLGKQQHEQLVREQHENPRSGNYAAVAPPALGEVDSGSASSILTFYHEIPPKHSKSDCIVVIPFKFATSLGFSAGIEHSQWGRLFPMHTRGPAFVAAAVLFGKHRSKESAFSCTLADAIGTQPRGRVSMWWAPATLPYLQMQLTATNLYRRNFVFSDPFAVLKLVDLAAEAAAGKNAVIAQRGKAELVYRTEVYRNRHRATFMPLTFSLPPSFVDPSVPLSDNARVNFFSVFNVYGILRSIEQNSSAGRATPRSSQNSHKTLSAFVPRAPRFKGRPSSAPARAPPPRHDDGPGHLAVPLQTWLFPMNVLPPAMMPEGCAPGPVGGSSQATSRPQHFANKDEWPIVVLSDAIQCELLDAEFDPGAWQCHPRIIGSFRFAILDLVRDARRYDTNQLLLEPPSPPRSAEVEANAPVAAPCSKQPSEKRHRPPWGSGPGREAAEGHVQPLQHEGANVLNTDGCQAESVGEARSAGVVRYRVRRSTTYDDATRPLHGSFYNVSAQDLRAFNEATLHQPNSQATSVVTLGRGSSAPTTVSRPSDALLTDVFLHKRFSFQHYISDDWELSSTIVVDFCSSEAQRLHRRQVFLNGWNVFQGLLVAINKLMVPYSSRGGSDLYGAGVGSDHQFTVRPIFQYPDLFGVHADETSNVKRGGFVRPPPPPPPPPRSAAAASSDNKDSSSSAAVRKESSPSPRPQKQPFPQQRDWSGEHTLPHYDAHRAFTSRASTSALSFFFIPIIRRVILRCEALQDIRSSGIRSSSLGAARASITPGLFHIVSIIVAARELGDTLEAADFLARAAAKPIGFIFIFVDCCAPSAFAGLPNVVTVNFPCSTGFAQLHCSFKTLESAFLRVPEMFLCFARSYGVLPGDLRATLNGDTEISTADSDFEPDEELAAACAKHSPRGDVTRKNADGKDAGQRAEGEEDAFDSAADRFNTAFGFRARPSSARKPSGGSSNSAPEGHVRLQLQDIEVGEFELQGNAENYFAEREQINFDEGNAGRAGADSADVDDRITHAGGRSPKLRDAAMTVVDLFMTEEEIMRQQAEQRRRNAHAVADAAASSGGLIDSVLVKRHLESIAEGSRRTQHAERRVAEDDFDVYSTSSSSDEGDAGESVRPSKRRARRPTGDAAAAAIDEAARDENDDDDDDDPFNMQLLSQQHQKNQNIYEFEVHGTGHQAAGVAPDPDEDTGPAGGAKPVAHRTVTTARRPSQCGDEELRDPNGPVARAMRRLKYRGSGTLQELSARFDFVIPQPPKLADRPVYAPYGSASRSRGEKQRLLGRVRHGEAVDRKLNARLVKPVRGGAARQHMSPEKEARFRALLESPKDVRGGPPLDVEVAQRQLDALEQLAAKRERQRQVDQLTAQERSKIVSRLQAKGAASGAQGGPQVESAGIRRRRTSVTSGSSVAPSARSGGGGGTPASMASLDPPDRTGRVSFHSQQ